VAMMKTFARIFLMDYRNETHKNPFDDNSTRDVFWDDREE